MGPLQQDDTPYVSTGQLPSPEQVRRAVDQAYERYRAAAGGQRSQVYPALARVPADLFGSCAVGTRGGVHATGDADHGFSIMSVAKPFVFALVCQALGPEEARDLLGANATGLPFNSLAAVERGPDGRTNPMVNPGAIATASLAPGPAPRPGGVPPRRAVAVPVPAAGADPVRVRTGDLSRCAPAQHPPLVGAHLRNASTSRSSRPDPRPSGC